VTAGELVTQSEGTTIVLALVNGAQLVLLAWIASRGTRRRRDDRRR
jgi:hypothetical protein